MVNLKVHSDRITSSTSGKVLWVDLGEGPMLRRVGKSFEANFKLNGERVKLVGYHARFDRSGKRQSAMLVFEML